jgi:GTP-binding protein Era
MTHKSGFVNIIGSPNVGKSTLMNQLVGERLSIITNKAQTTRHRIMGIVNTEDYQIVYSDTPGLVNSAYALHDSMMKFVKIALQDADIILLVIEVGEKKLNHLETLDIIVASNIPIIIALNKVDKSDESKVKEQMEYWQEKIPRADIFPISALHGFNVESLFNRLIELLPEAPPFYDKEELTDKPLKFFVSEIIREKIFMHYKKEIPYASEVEIERYKDLGDIIHIDANIMVERPTQKGIIIGHMGKALKRVGTEARIDMEKFLGKKVFLKLHVKVDKDWRSKKTRLKYYGYNQ